MNFKNKNVTEQTIDKNKLKKETFILQDKLNKNLNLSSEELANKAIRKGFEVLKKKILLEDDL